MLLWRFQPSQKNEETVSFAWQQMFYSRLLSTHKSKMQCLWIIVTHSVYSNGEITRWNGWCLLPMKGLIFQFNSFSSDMPDLAHVHVGVLLVDTAGFGLIWLQRLIPCKTLRLTPCGHWLLTLQQPPHRHVIIRTSNPMKPPPTTHTSLRGILIALIEKQNCIVIMIIMSLKL